MNINQLYDELVAMLPIRQKKDDNFREKLREILKDYCLKINKLNIADKGTISDWAALEQNISALCKSLNDIILVQYKGQHSTAFTKLKNVISKNISEIIFLQSVNCNFYRMRTFDNKKEANRDNMFHIPLTSRGIVKTQRYSMPGYPCLYLGYSIYGCWEEMERPVMNSCMVSLIKNSAGLKLIDLRIPSRADFQANPRKFLGLFPLIIACMFQVKDIHATYKPEYIISQLMTELIINCYPKEKIHGIIYTSSHKNSDFEFPIPKFDNIAIPVINSLSKDKFCKTLCSIFTITEPTCDEYEQLKCGYGINCGVIGLSPDEQLNENYKTSNFGNLEERLKDNAKFPLYTLD